MSPNELNTEIINDLKDILGDGFKGLIEVQLEQAEEYLSAIDGYLAVDDKEKIAATAHSLKSSAGQVGLLGIYEMSRQLEYEAKQNGMECGRMQMQLKEAYPHAVATLQQYIAA